VMLFNKAEELNEIGEGRPGLRTDWLDCPICGRTCLPASWEYHREEHPSGPDPWWLRLLRWLAK